MTTLLYLTYFFHIVIAIVLILVILLQQGKGADFAVFGGGSTQSAFGARGAVQMIHKLTVTGFVLFIVTTLLIGVLQVRISSGNTVMEDAAIEAVTGQDDLVAEEPVTEGETDALTDGGEGDSADSSEASPENDTPAALPEEDEGAPVVDDPPTE